MISSDKQTKIVLFDKILFISIEIFCLVHILFINALHKLQMILEKMFWDMKYWAKQISNKHKLYKL